MVLQIQIKNSKRMHQVIALGLVCTALTGCDRHTRITEDYEFVQPQSYMIEPGSTACALYYKGKKVWRSVVMGDEKTCRDGIFVFMSVVPYIEGGSDVHSQLFAIRGEGPAVLLSERVLNEPCEDVGHHHSTNDGEYYFLDEVTPVPDGVQVVYNRGPDKTGADNMTTNDLSWNTITNWVSEAETSAPIQVAPSGNYRILPLETAPQDLATPKK
jgi:hypothetical protein